MGSNQSEAPRESLSVVFVTLELSPYFKITGIGDLLRNIISELRRRHIKVTVIGPDFGCDYPNLVFKKSRSFYSAVSGKTTAFYFRQAEDATGTKFYLLKNSSLQQYLANLPKEPDDPAENGRLFLEFCYGAYLLLEALTRRELSFKGDGSLVLHAFHWQVCPLLALLNQAPWRQRLRTILTVDILDTQGRFESEILNIHESYRQIRANEPGEINFLRLGLEAADMLHTVSPNFAHEIQQVPNGRGLEDILQDRFQANQLIGILNGLDPQLTDWQCIPVLKENGLCITPTVADVREHKSRAKLLFQQAAGLPQDPEAFLISMGHRFVYQKNFAAIINAIPGLMALHPRPQLYLRAWPEPDEGGREWELWWQLVRLSKRYRFHLAFLSPYDRDLSLVEEGIFIDRFLYYAASDLFLMPSLWEPCGLCQLEAMRFGAIPVVTAVGGLMDTVKPFTGDAQGWGFLLEDPFDSEELITKVAQAMQIWRQQSGVWRAMLQRAMTFDSSIAKTVDNYLTKLYLI
jgi:starch synthase